MKEFIKSTAGVITGVVAAIAGVIALYGYGAGWYNNIRQDAVADKEQAYIDSVARTMVLEYIEFEDKKNLPFILQQKYEERGEHIDSAHKAINAEIDSANFIIMQACNIIFSQAFAKVQLVTDPHGCRYWLNVDPAGQYWWRDRVKDKNGDEIKTYPYRVAFNKSTGSYEYTDYHGRVRNFKHKWQGGENEQ